MKKVKLMLLSLALLSVVGVALAFKARFEFTYCTTAAVQDAQGRYVCPVNATCPNKRQNHKIDPLGDVFCTTTPSTSLQDPSDPNSIISICTDAAQPGGPALPCDRTTHLWPN